MTRFPTRLNKYAVGFSVCLPSAFVFYLFFSGAFLNQRHTQTQELNLGELTNTIDLSHEY